MTIKKLIIKGSSLENAIQMGLSRIGLPQSRTVIKVLQKKENTLFLNRDLIIAIFFDEKDSRQALIERARNDLTAKGAIRWTNGKALFRCSPIVFDEQCFRTEEERYRFLLEYVKDNGLLEFDETAIRSIARNPKSVETYVPIKTLSTIPLKNSDASISIEISKNRMSARAVIFHGEIPPEEGAVFEVLKSKSIVKGILRRVIGKVLESKFSGFFTIAVGKADVPDVPGPLQLYFHENEHREFAKMMESLTIDTRNVKDINVVDRNELLMEIGEPLFGEDGYRIDGSVIKKQRNDKALTIGSNVYLSDNGKEVYAKAAGHIMWKPALQFLDVEQIYVVEGNVDFSGGNITGFVGKVLVKGDVRPKFSVTAEGDIEIHGSVEDAVIESTKGSVIIRGTVVHNNEGYVQAAEDIHATIAMNATLKAKNIFIEKEAMNCKLQASNSIVATGNPGAIVGGTARAKKLIRANKIGSESWIATKIHVGDCSQLQQLLRSLQQRSSRQKAEFDELRGSTAMLQARKESHGLSDVQEQQLKQALIRLPDLEGSIVFDQEEDTRIRQEVVERKDAHLEILDVLYPHCDLYIYLGYFLPNEKQIHVGFHCQNGLVVSYPL